MKCSYDGCRFDSDSADHSLQHIIEHLLRDIDSNQSGWSAYRKRKAAESLDECLAEFPPIEDFPSLGV